LTRAATGVDTPTLIDVTEEKNKAISSVLLSDGIRQKTVDWVSFTGDGESVADNSVIVA
jgi:hypothetical protein